MPHTFEIHPAIGIARVGSSSQFFIGPEPDGKRPAKYRDATGKLLRQAARFRIFDCQRSANGTLEKATEVKVASTQITWKVHLVNRKGAALKFVTPGGGHRNHATGNDQTDAALIIDPGLKTLKGPGQGPVTLDGSFMGVPVTLGDLRTEASGRLVVAGGFGRADSVPAQPNPDAQLVSFADNNNWFDDTSDGIIQAELRLKDGTHVQAKSAWVIVGPPDFAPEIENLITLYDIALEAAVERGLASAPSSTSFTRHILPILARAVGYQWVNKFNRTGHSGTRPGNFLRNLAAMAVTNPPPAEARVLLRRLRDSSLTPPGGAPEPNRRSWMPRLHQELGGPGGDDSVLPLTRLQYKAMKDWAAGHFVNDLGQAPPPEQLVDALDRTALQSGSGGAFYPGIECGAIMKDPHTYSEAFRIDTAKIRPGQITQQNALPWQADFYACSWEPQAFMGWWPAQRPDHVMTATGNAPIDWMRGVDSDMDLVTKWDKLGVVAKVATPAGTVFQETERLLP